MLHHMRSALPEAELPQSYRWVGWDHATAASHANVLFRAFANELDSQIFPSFRSFDTCLELIDDIRSRVGFLEPATWLIAREQEFVGAVQGVINSYGDGAIQNVAVLPTDRNRGLGRCLMIKALRGFRKAGIRRSTLEVTATNNCALRLYRGLGYVRTKTLIKEFDSGIESARYA